VSSIILDGPDVAVLATTGRGRILGVRVGH
jgi:hypothetical protein